MREVFMLNRITLDGFFCDPGGGKDWFIPDQDIDNATHQLIDADTLVFGRTTYTEMESYWTMVDQDPNASPEAHRIAREIIDMPKVVFSKTVTSAKLANARLTARDPIAEIRQLKQGSGSGMLILGSGSIVQPLTDAGLIDDYVLILSPTILGAGKPLFKQGSLTNLKLVASQSYSTGNVLLHYQAQK